VEILGGNSLAPTDRLGGEKNAVSDREFGHRPHGVVNPLRDPHSTDPTDLATVA